MILNNKEQINNSNNIVLALQKQVFRYGLILAIGFRVFRSVSEYLIDSPLFIQILGVINLMALFWLLWIYTRHMTIAYYILFLQILLSCIITWNNSGGLNGTIPGLLIIVVTASIMTGKQLPRLYILIAYAIGIFLLIGPINYLPTFSEWNSNYSVVFMRIDLLMETIVLVALTVYMKDRFIKYRKHLKSVNVRLEKTTKILNLQKSNFQEQEIILNEIRQKLKQNAEHKIREGNTKSQILDYYAFINAHKVRAPLARILGLIHLIEIEEGEPQAKIQIIKENALQLDVILKSLNETVNW